MKNFICKKCGNTTYTMQEKLNGTGKAIGLYCAKCGTWHKWLNKQEKVLYSTHSAEIDYVADSKAVQTITDLLIEFDEMGFAPTTVCPDGEKYAVDWRERVRKEFARLAAENKRLREEVAEQKSIADHEHAAQMKWFSIACDYKAEAAALQKRLDNAVELPCKAGDTVYFIPASISSTFELFIYEWKIESIIIKGKGYTLNCVDSKKRFCYMFDRLFGIQWFTDRTKAEARLAELKGGNQ